MIEPATEKSDARNYVEKDNSGKNYGCRFLILTILTYTLVAFILLSPQLVALMYPDAYGLTAISIIGMFTLPPLVICLGTGTGMVITGSHYLKRNRPRGKRRIATIISLSVFSVGTLYCIVYIAAGIMMAQHASYSY
jgi:hypothetical protein